MESILFEEYISCLLVCTLRKEMVGEAIRQIVDSFRYTYSGDSISFTREAKRIADCYYERKKSSSPYFRGFYPEVQIALCQFGAGCAEGTDGKRLYQITVILVC